MPGVTISLFLEFESLRIALHSCGDATTPSKDFLLTSQLRTALILNKKIKATNYQIDTYKQKIYIYGIAIKSEEKDLVIDEAKQILDVKDVIASIILVEDLRIQKN